ncbi:hypothetical protein [Alkalinema sp. FACHB-956]|uniref:hypothetical protein n=1 Tax=Alkalinema sp. FACHB-956 TaxID=2692768 RepID=UPI0016887A42|nr:hypothetical protein [Alkalinema sp. FACHB-956]MBD2328907.1 hypothetical protein [Alkalinema sp. FACHB-956]
MLRILSSGVLTSGILTSGLMVVTLSAFAIAPAQAQTRIDYQLSMLNVPSYSMGNSQLNPADIASLAYQGLLKDQGIPSYAALSNAYAGGSLTAKDVINAAIAAQRISSAALEDSAFVNAVDSQLRTLLPD